jgi:hypothetical protein
VPIERGMRNLRILVACQSLFWFFAAGGFVAALVFIPKFYWIFGYLAIVSCCFVFYHIYRFRVVSTLSKLVSHAVLGRYFEGTLYVKDEMQSVN